MPAPAAPLADTRVHVFLGKGGVGKTTCSAAAALHFAECGDRTLVLSTDPTPSLSHIFDRERSAPEQAIADGLFMTELGLDEVRRMWDERFGRDVYAVFSAFVDVDYETFVEFMTSVLPGLNEEFMVDHVRRLVEARRYERIVWDTAPLGQTLALLGTPSLLAQHLRMAPRVYSHLRTSGAGRESIMDVLHRWDALATTCMEFLRRAVRFEMVTIPETLALRQLDDVFRELARYGLRVERLIVNNVVVNADSPFLVQKSTQQQHHLRELRARYRDVPIVEVPLFPQEIQGVARLRQVASVIGPSFAGG
ncbi:MAG TPA: ArsA family ATPase [Gemmatimonadaceae bacterium]|nr:ArsA family ATPase [Gemmatimonadaceae bacterium]